MPISTISSKGQITLPVRLRRQMKMKPNDPVTIEAVGDAIVIKRATNFFELKAFLGKAVTGKEEQAGMHKAVSRHVRGE